MGNARTKTTLGGGKFGATETSRHVLCPYYTRWGDKARAKTQIEYALESASGQNNNGIRCSGRSENIGCGIAGSRAARPWRGPQVKHSVRRVAREDAFGDPKGTHVT